MGDEGSQQYKMHSDYISSSSFAFSYKTGFTIYHNVPSQPEAVNFSMGIDVTKRNRVPFQRFVTSMPIENVTASGM